MGLFGDSVERVETMPGPAWLRDGLGVIGYVLFFVFPLGVVVSLLSAAQVFVDAKAMDVASPHPGRGLSRVDRDGRTPDPCPASLHLGPLAFDVCDGAGRPAHGKAASRA